MTDATDLYAAVLADPFDMDLRLRYADAVAGSDPAHAELIRLQIAHDRLAIAGEPVDGAEAVRRKELSFEVARRIGGDLGGLVDNSQLRRGFAEILFMSGPDFLARGAELSRLVPWRGAVLSGVDADVAADLAASPLLGRLVALDLGGSRFGDAGLKALLGSPHLGRLRWLDLSTCRIDRGGVTALGRTARAVLPDLRYLGFDDNPIPVTPVLREIPGQAQSWDTITEFEVFWPQAGINLNTRYGPFRWLNETFARSGAPDYTAV